MVAVVAAALVVVVAVFVAVVVAVVVIVDVAWLETVAGNEQKAKWKSKYNDRTTLVSTILKAPWDLCGSLTVTESKKLFVLSGPMLIQVYRLPPLPPTPPDTVKSGGGTPWQGQKVFQPVAACGGRWAALKKLDLRILDLRI